MATSPARIATTPKAMPATAVRGLFASPRVTRPRAMSPVTTAAIPKGTPISSQQVMSATHAQDQRSNAELVSRCVGVAHGSHPLVARQSPGRSAPVVCPPSGGPG